MSEFISFLVTGVVTGSIYAVTASGLVVTYNATGATGGIAQLGAGNQITFTPNINKALLTTGISGNIDWACASSTNATATAAGLKVTVPTTPVLAKYVPSQCK